MRFVCNCCLICTPSDRTILIYTRRLTHTPSLQLKRWCFINYHPSIHVHLDFSCSKYVIRTRLESNAKFNPLNPELNPISYFLALLAHHFLHVSRIRVKSLTLRPLMSHTHTHTHTHTYIYITLVA